MRAGGREWSRDIGSVPVATKITTGNQREQRCAYLARTFFHAMRCKVATSTFSRECRWFRVARDRPNNTADQHYECNRLFSTAIILGMRKGVALFEFACLIVMMGCARSGCDNEALSEHVSPDGHWKYVSFDRNCGATTGSNLQISVLPASKSLPSGAANAFIADDNQSATRFVAQPQWLSSRKLRIAYSPKARVFKKEASVGPIEIEYVQEP
jgi:hypothetical protein